MYVRDERPYHWNSLEVHLEHYDIHLTYAWLIRGDITLWPTFPLVTYSWDSELKSSTTIYSSSDHPMFSDKAPGPICNLGHDPYNIYIYIYNCIHHQYSNKYLLLLFLFLFIKIDNIQSIYYKARIRSTKLLWYYWKYLKLMVKRISHFLFMSRNKNCHDQYEQSGYLD